MLFSSLLTFILISLSSQKMKQALSDVSQTIQLPSPPKIDLTSSLVQSSILGNDVAISPEGEIYVVGIDGKLYTYNFATNSYQRVVADPDIDGIQRVTVDSEGTPYIVTNCGSTYYLSCDGRWIQLPGCATDIGAGSCGEVWKIGCDKREGGYGVWKLFCKGKEKKCNRYRQFNYGAKYSHRINQRKKCQWYRVSGSGSRIDVYPDGKVAVVQSNGAAMKYNGKEWSMITQYSGRDISVSNEGVVLMTGVTNGLYIIQKNSKEGFFDERYDIGESNNSIEALDINTKYLDIGCTMAVASGPYSQAALIPCISMYDPVLVLTQKFDYN